MTTAFLNASDQGDQSGIAARGASGAPGGGVRSMKLHRASAFADAVSLDGRGRRTPQTMLLLDERDHLLREAAEVLSRLQ